MSQMTKKKTNLTTNNYKTPHVVFSNDCLLFDPSITHTHTHTQSFDFTILTMLLFSIFYTLLHLSYHCFLVFFFIKISHAKRKITPTLSWLNEFQKYWNKEKNLKKYEEISCWINKFSVENWRFVGNTKIWCKKNRKFVLAICTDCDWNDCFLQWNGKKKRKQKQIRERIHGI